MDLAEGHIAALRKLFSTDKIGTPLTLIAKIYLKLHFIMQQKFSLDFLYC